jgi:peptide deformylase
VVPYTIRTFGDPVLKQRAKDVTEIDGDLVRVVGTMFETMYEARGVGLAAPQVGIQRRFFTYDVDDDPGVLINPEIVETAGEWVYDEGCLSVPGLHFEIVRPNLVTVRGMDLDGNEVIVQADELMGRLLQHEIDHLDGVLLLDRLEPEVRREALRELRQRDPATATVPAGGDDHHRL